MIEFSHIELTTGWGYEYFFVCSECAALVNNCDLHREWHERQKENPNA